MSLDHINLPQLKETTNTSTLLAHCMWKDERAGEIYEADLNRVSDGEGNEWWEVDRTVTQMALDAGEPEVTHTEFDNFEAAVECYGDAVQITIYAS